VLLSARMRAVKKVARVGVGSARRAFGAPEDFAGDLLLTLVCGFGRPASR